MLLTRLVIIPTELTPNHWFLYDSQELVLVQPEAYLQLSQTYMMQLFYENEQLKTVDNFCKNVPS